MNDVAQKQIEDIRNIRETINHLSLEHQQIEIQRLSPYSNEITPYITQYNELQLYCSLQLKESYITRPAIIRDIDFDLWIASENCSNLELMQKGCAPYEFDAPEGKIELHHIGQDDNAPLAELTWEEHDENSKLLHPSHEDSWRSKKGRELQFNAERTEYWKRRAKQDYLMADYLPQELPANQFQNQKEYTDEIRKTCEALFSQCQAEDLDYLSDLAKSYGLMQRIGSTTLSQFLQITQQEHNGEITCPGCGAKKYVLNGTYQTASEKIQRYKCKCCGRVFSPVHKTLISGSSVSFKDWLKFIDCLYNGYSLKQTAEVCDISEATAQDNRIKLFYALKLLNDQVQLKGKVALDETYLPLSYKGNHSKDGEILPRQPHNRGGENHKKGLSKNLVCVVCAIDEFGNSVAKVTGTGTPSGLKLKYALQDHLGDEIVCLYSDKSAAIRKFAELCGHDIKQDKLLKKGNQYAKGVSFNKDTLTVNRYLQVGNSYHSRLKKFLRRFSGISTKYLSGYLYLFTWRERTKNMEPEDIYKELLQIMVRRNECVTTSEIIKSGLFPNVKTIDQCYRAYTSRNLERNQEIYNRYGAGETMASIGQDIGMSAKNVGYIIGQMRKKGLACRTQRDILREQKQVPKPNRFYSESQQHIINRNIQIFQEKLQWEGTVDAFNKKMSRKYNLSVSRIKNIVSQMRRIQKLTDEIFVFEDVSYRSSKEVYQAVYADWLKLQDEDPKPAKAAILSTLAAKHNFSATHIGKIIEIMTDDFAEEYFQKKRKLTTVETYNRDKALFIDYLRWCGTRKEFCDFAGQKYNLSACTVYEIIQYCLCADFKRVEMV